jgi:release factor glutamine methyltransferase
MYLPAEDSCFLSEILAAYLKTQDKKIKILDSKKILIKNFRGARESFRILDIGSGTGIQSETCLKLGFRNILASDIDSEVINYLNSKFKNKLRIIKSDLFSNLKNKFDLIIFNPPYLPEDKFDSKLDTTAGKSGNELILRFLKQAKTHLNQHGRILILFSSLSKPEIILKTASKLKYKSKLIASKNLFFEKLFIYEFY